MDIWYVIQLLIEMADVAVTFKKPEIVKQYSLSVDNLKTTSIGDVSMPNSEPIEIKNEQVHFHPSKMVKGKYYNFPYKGKEYLLRKTGDKVIDIFEIK